MKISKTYLTFEMKEFLERICIRADKNNGVAEFLSNELFTDTASKRRFMHVAHQGTKSGLWGCSYSRKNDQGVQVCKFTPCIRIVSYSKQLS